MALDTDRPEILSSRTVVPVGTGDAETFRARALALAAGALCRLRDGWRVFVALPIPRAVAGVFGGSLLRRIVLSNLLGLGILLIGLVFISQHNAWLIDAKRDSLIVQGEIIAKAIAANASIDNQGTLRVDPDRLLSVDGSLIPFRDDGFSALELSLAPERVTPVLRRLIEPTSNRARIFARDGTLIVDSDMLLRRDATGQFAPPTTGRQRSKNFWTRATQWMMWTELPVYHDLGAANGMSYREVPIALTGVTTPLLQLTPEGEVIVSVAVPIQRARSVQGVLLLSTLPGDVDEQLANERNMILMLALLSVIATLAAATLLARMVAGPIRRLSDAAVNVSLNRAGPEDIPDFSSRGDEVGQLSRSLSQMTGTLYRRIEASEKFAADVAHELKNPLTAARAMAESLGYARTDEQRNQLVGQIQHELKRLNRLITDVSNASRLDAELARQQLEPVDIAAVASGVVSTFRDILSGDSRQVVLEVQEPSIMVRGHDGRLGQVLTNLIDNAISFSPDTGTVVVRIARRGDGVEIVIDDEGPGIPPDKLDKVFERFYTDRPQTEAQRGKNSGLGLSICREIIDAHNGRIWAENRYAGAANGTATGARFIVKLPPASGLPARRG